MPVKPDTFSNRPALVLARGPIAFLHLALDDFDGLDPRTGKVTRTTLYQGTFTLFALSRVMLESENLAYFCATEAMSRRDSLQKQGGFFETGQVPGIGAPSSAGSIVADDRGDTVIATPVSLPFYLPWKTEVTPLGAPILEGVDISMFVGDGDKNPPVPVEQVPGYPSNKLHPADHPMREVRYVFPRSYFGRGLPSPKQPVAPLNPPKPIILRFGV